MFPTTMAVKHVPGMLKVASIILFIFLHLQLVQTAPNWRPGLRPRRRNGEGEPTIPGCWTPHGMMELGQRIYPRGCSRVVCKTISGDHIIEHQFCNDLPSRLPLNCVVRTRPWKRYPDCCPDVYCSPSSSFHSGNPTNLRSYQPEPEIEAHKQSSFNQHHGAISGPHYNVLRDADLPEPHFNLPPVTSAPNFDLPEINSDPLYMTTEIIYGKGFSDPYEHTTTSPLKYTFNEHIIGDVSQQGNIWEADDSHYMVSPVNTLSGLDASIWNTETNTEAPLQYKEDFVDSTTTRSNKVTPYIISYPPAGDIIYPATPKQSSPASYSFFTDAKNVKTSPLPYRQYHVVNRPTISQPFTTQVRKTTKLKTTTDDTTTTKEITRPYHIHTTELKNITQTPYIKPTTYSPHTKLGHRYRPTLSIRRTTTHRPVYLNTKSQKITTPSTEWATKALKEPTTSAAKETQNSSYYNTKRLTTSRHNLYTRKDFNSPDITRLPAIRQSATTPYERVTKRTRISPPSKKYVASRKTTVAPEVLSKTTPPSYEFATPKLNPNNHDLIEFIHSTLDPSALIPGHDGYIQSKFDSKREYTEKDEEEVESHPKKIRRSLTYEQTTIAYDGIEEIKEEKNETRGRPVFYIPWLDYMENNLAIDIPTEIPSMSTEMPEPLIKFEYPAIILQDLTNSSKPSFSMKPTLLLENNKYDSYISPGTGILEMNHFSEGNQTKESDKFYDNVPTSENYKISESGQLTESENIVRSGQTAESKIISENHKTPENNNVSESEQTIENEATVEAIGISNGIHGLSDVNKYTFSKINVSLEITQNKPQLKVNETTIKSPSHITHATVTSTTKYPNSQIKDDENKNQRYISNTSEIISLKGDSLEQNGLEKSSTENTQILSGNQNNSTSNNQRMRIPFYRRGPSNRHRGRGRKRRPTSSIIRSNSRRNMNQNEQILNKSTSTSILGPQVQQQNSSLSAKRLRHSRKRRPSLRYSRTRIQVPVQNYERNNEKDSDILRNEPKKISIGLQKLYLNERVTSRNNSQISDSDTQAEKSATIEITSLAPQTNIERDEGREITAEEKVPIIIDTTSDQIRRHSYSQFLTKEIKNKYQPGKQTERQSNNPYSTDSSEISATMNSTHTVEQVKDSYYELESYSNHFDDPHVMSTEESTAHNYNFHSDQETKSEHGIIRENNANHEVPTSATTLREGSHHFVQDLPLGYVNPHQEPSSNTAISEEYFSPPSNNRFMENFGDFSQEDWSNDPNFGSIFPPNEDKFDNSHEAESKPNYSQNNGHNTKTNVPSTENKDSNKHSQNYVKSNKTLTVPQKTPILSQYHTAFTTKANSATHSPSLPIYSLQASLHTKESVTSAIPKSSSKTFSRVTSPNYTPNFNYPLRYHTLTTIPSSHFTQKAITSNPSTQITEITEINQHVITAMPNYHSYIPQIKEKNASASHSQPPYSNRNSQTEQPTGLTQSHPINRTPATFGFQQRKSTESHDHSSTTSLSTTEKISTDLENTELSSQTLKYILQPTAQPNIRQRVFSFTQSTKSYSQPSTDKVQSTNPQTVRFSPTSKNTFHSSGTIDYKLVNKEEPHSYNSPSSTRSPSSSEISPSSDFLNVDVSHLPDTSLIYPEVWEPQRQAP